MLKVLLNNRANMDKADANQKRPIELACENSYISIFSLLKLYGARIDGPIVSTFFDDNYRQIGIIFLSFPLKPYANMEEFSNI